MDRLTDVPYIDPQTGDAEWFFHYPSGTSRALGVYTDACGEAYLMPTGWFFDGLVGPGNVAVVSKRVALFGYRKGDFNRDGFVDFFDYDDFIACFEGTFCPPGASADFDCDGFADFFDSDAFVFCFQYA